MLIHSTCVAVEGRAALLLGPSGSGKSDLALRLISQSFRFGGRVMTPELVADDQVELQSIDGRLMASAPVRIAGLIEVRGIGIVTVARTAAAEVVLAVNLVSDQVVERLPEAGRQLDLAGFGVPLMDLRPFEASTPAKVVMALSNTGGAA